MAILYTLTLVHPSGDLDLTFSKSGIIHPANDRSLAIIAYDMMTGEDAWWRKLKQRGRDYDFRCTIATLMFRCLYPEYAGWTVTTHLDKSYLVGQDVFLPRLSLFPKIEMAELHLHYRWWQTVYQEGMLLAPDGFVLGRQYGSIATLPRVLEPAHHGPTRYEMCYYSRSRREERAA